MGRIRVYEIARRFNVTSKEVLSRLSEMGVEARTHSSSVPEDVLQRLEGLFRPGRGVDVKKEEVIAPEVEEKVPGKKETEVVIPEPQKEIPEKGGKEIVEEDEDVIVPDRFRSQLKGLTQEKFKVKPAMQRAFDTIKRVDISRKRRDFGRGHARHLKKHHARKADSAVTTAPTQPRKKVLKFHEGTTVKEFSELIGQKVPEVIKKFMELGIMTTINQPVDVDAAQLIAESFGVQIEPVHIETEEEFIEEAEVETANLKPRPPIVTIMGHVDHGKTTLLDAIRKTRVTESEAGGITQHIGAYKVRLKDREITFLDTPGHEAFTMMRARGAKVTDIVILVVAADDGVMPQTIEAIDHAKAANVPIVVAVNKIDKPEANVERVKQELAKHDIVPEEWGGRNIFVEISAKKNIGIENLLEMVLLQADIMELKADYDRPARGTIIEAKLDRGRGPVATVLVNNGTLRQGDPFLVGTIAGRVRGLINETGKRVNEASPSTPVEVLGFPEVPQAGDIFVVMKDEKRARQIALSRLQKQKSIAMAMQKRLTLDELFERIKEGEIKELNVIIKADVQGSVEAMRDAFEGIKHPEVKVRVIHAGVGGINESDVMLASASNAIVIGFNIRPDPKASALAEREGVDIRLYSVIYEAIEDIKKALEGLLEPAITEKVLGRAEVRQTFSISKVGTVAGCYVLDGVVSRASSGIRVIRDNVVVYDSKIASLKRFKEDVREVQAGYECGILIENFNDIKVGDILEVYQKEEVAARLG